MKVWNPNKFAIRRSYPDGSVDAKDGTPKLKVFSIQPEAAGEAPDEKIAQQLVEDFGCTIGGKPKTQDEIDQEAAEKAEHKAAEKAEAARVAAEQKKADDDAKSKAKGGGG